MVIKLGVPGSLADRLTPGHAHAYLAQRWELPADDSSPVSRASVGPLCSTSPHTDPLAGDFPAFLRPSRPRCPTHPPPAVPTFSPGHRLSATKRYRFAWLSTSCGGSRSPAVWFPLLLLPTHPDSFPIRRARAHGCCPGTPRSPRSSALACAAACYRLSYEALAPTGAENAASGLHTAPRASSARIPWASVLALLVPRTELWHTGLT